MVSLVSCLLQNRNIHFSFDPLSMNSLKFILFSILCLFCGFVVSQDKYNEKCTITSGSGLVVDSCDSSQFLTCNSGYCGCSDPSNQVYGWRYIRDYDKTNSRTKRSPKKGKGNSIF